MINSLGDTTISRIWFLSFVDRMVFVFLRLPDWIYLHFSHDPRNRQLLWLLCAFSTLFLMKLHQLSTTFFKMILVLPIEKFSCGFSHLFYMQIVWQQFCIYLYIPQSANSLFIYHYRSSKWLPVSLSLESSWQFISLLFFWIFQRNIGFSDVRIVRGKRRIQRGS